jgi:APA family basic amino acid/polyamine antiporter
MALISYFPYLSVNPRWAAIAVIGIITFIHTRNLKTSAVFQNASTVIKLLLIVFLIVMGAFLPGIASGENTGKASFVSELISPPFAISLVYVIYSYSGWNAAAYITSEFENPKKSLPIVLIGGTLLVTILYSLLQYIFLKHLTLTEMEGQLNVAALAAQKMFGLAVGNLFGLAISLSLISSVSAMVWVGARITASMADDHVFLSFFKMQSNHLPVRALWLQWGISSLLILTGTFEQILIYCGILISLSSMLVVICIYKIRNQPAAKQDIGFKSPCYPFFQIIFTLLTLWMIFFTLYDKPLESLAGIINLLIGLASFYWGHSKLKYFQK